MRSSPEAETENCLKNEKSPYLLQHATNPVDWYPWSEGAFERAEREGKPIFLSIGYSTCHWCHVMAHESFEDSEVAELLNEHFISIKLDREERPDLDQIYMLACQMLTGSGGWPLTVMMSPDRRPFFAGTYFPKESQGGRIGMKELIPRVANIWKNERQEIDQAIAKISSALNDIRPGADDEIIDESVLHSAFQQLSDEFDTGFGGFGNAPKFPTPHRLTFLLRYAGRTGNSNAIEIANQTLKKMAQGGLRDHIGGGFHRYSTDRTWLLPHFEKMLYDQAMLVIAYSEAYRLTRDGEFREIVDEMIDYVQRELTSPDSGFYSAEDADSEGVEGKFYVWEKSEIDEVLGEDAVLFCECYSISEEGNFLDEATRDKTGANILHLQRVLEVFADAEGIPLEQLKSRLTTMREKLFEVREKRSRPHKDDKVLTDWNGLMIASLAIAGKVFGESAYIEMASRAAEFIERELVRSDELLLHRYREGDAQIDAFLDDYAFYTWGLLELYEASSEPEYLARAIEMNDQLMERCWDFENGAFFFTSEASSDVILRMKETYDGAIPSGNSVAMSNLVKLSHYTANLKFDEYAVQLAHAIGERVRQIPSSHTQLLQGIDLVLGPVVEVVIVGEPGDERTNAMLNRLRAEYIPRVVLHHLHSGNQPELSGLAPFVAEMKMISGNATAYVCKNQVCELPTTDPEKMIEIIRS